MAGRIRNVTDERNWPKMSAPAARFPKSVSFSARQRRWSWLSIGCEIEIVNGVYSVARRQNLSTACGCTRRQVRCLNLFVIYWNGAGVELPFSVVLGNCSIASRNGLSIRPYSEKLSPTMEGNVREFRVFSFCV